MNDKDNSTPQERREWLLIHLVPMAKAQNPDSDYEGYIKAANQEWIDKSYWQLRYDIIK